MHVFVGARTKIELMLDTIMVTLHSPSAVLTAVLLHAMQLGEGL